MSPGLLPCAALSCSCQGALPDPGNLLLLLLLHQSFLSWIFARVSIDGRSCNGTFPKASISCALFLSVPGFLKVHLIQRCLNICL